VCISGIDRSNAGRARASRAGMYRNDRRPRPVHWTADTLSITDTHRADDEFYRGYALRGPLGRRRAVSPPQTSVFVSE